MERIASGRDADVFALDDSRVLRRCRDRETRCEPMAEMMELARVNGFPVPRVYSVSGPDVVLERVGGQTMLASLIDGATPIDTGAQLLVDLHARLHAVPVAPEHGLDVALCHLDLHPDNVLLADSGPVLIDWSNSRFARPGYDRALTAVILAQVALDDHPLQDEARALLDAFLDRSDALERRDIDAAVANRAANITMAPHEVAVLPQCAELLVQRGGKGGRGAQGSG